MRIAIIGGGLGGLAAALFLEKVGLTATVYEQARELREAGAGIVVAPNMVRPMRTLGLVPAEKAPAIALRPVQTLWLGPGRHFVHYPISAGRLVNVVAIAPAGAWRDESWTADGEISDLSAEFEGWDERLQRLIVSASSTKRWAMYDRDPIERWTEGRITLLGDAAHAMLPFLAQGAAQAIEDAFVLAGCLRDADHCSVPQALQRYEDRRRPRAREVQLMSRGREIRNHLPDGPEQRERDTQFANGDPLRQSAWLYGYDLEADVRG
jgi:salicylate hydroxylase